MKLSIIFTILFWWFQVSIQNFVYAQSTVYIGTKKYIATDDWDFTVNGYWSQGPAHVKIAKNAGAGFLFISLASFDGNLKGNIIIYLENGTAIKCLDRGIRDNVDNTTISVFNLTPSEMQMLKNSDISSIRFSLYQYTVGYHNYTMDNRYELPFDNLKIYQNSTANAVRKLLIQN